VKNCNLLFDEERIAETKSAIQQNQNSTKNVELKNSQLLKEYEVLCKKIALMSD
jgi:hypothetical protein